MFAIEMLPANHGDGLWIEYGEERDTRHVLIDGGPPYASDTIRARLERAGGHLELLVISHVDFDHVGGVVTMLARPPDGMRIDEVWFNGWRHLPGTDDLLGPVQGEMVTAAIENLELNWNRAAIAVRPSRPLPSRELGGGLKLTVLGPTVRALDALRPKWEAEVSAAGMRPGNFEDALKKLRERERLPDELGDGRPDLERLDRGGFSEDKSLANRSSIALLAEYDGRAALFAADSPPGALLPSIEMLCAERETTRLKLDAAKLAHHGSKGSTSADLIDRLDCPRYLISTNGKIFSHPSPETLARTILHGGKHPQLLFNYRTPHANLFDDDKLREKHGYTTVFPVGGDGLRIDL